MKLCESCPSSWCALPRCPVQRFVTRRAHAYYPLENYTSSKEAEGSLCDSSFSAAFNRASWRTRHSLFDPVGEWLKQPVRQLQGIKSGLVTTHFQRPTDVEVHPD